VWGALSNERTGLSITVAAGLARTVILGYKSSEHHGRIILSQIRDYPNLEDPRNRVAQLYPQAPGSLFVASYSHSRLTRYTTSGRT
jgi:hypothetical protein